MDAPTTNGQPVAPGGPPHPWPPAAAPQHLPTAPSTPHAAGYHAPIANLKLLVLMSGLAVILSIVAVMFAFTSRGSGMGKGLSGYDFSSPEDALKSSFKVRASSDMRAWVQMWMRRDSASATEALKSLKVEEELTHKEFRILLYSYDTDDGFDTKHDVQGFRRVNERWLPTYVPTYDMGDKDLEKKIREWRSSGD